VFECAQNNEGLTELKEIEWNNLIKWKLKMLLE
jgi:hypothetical protein